MNSAVRQGTRGVNARSAPSSERAHATSPLATLDLDLARRASMGQDPLDAGTDARGATTAVAITCPYGRLGNNAYQILNAALVARAGGFDALLIPPGMAAIALPNPFVVDGLRVAAHAGEAPAGCLTGSFYVPFGCEAPVLRWPAARVDALARGLCDTLFGAVIAEAGTPDRIAVAFRAGDVFTCGPQTPIAYTQPPAAYYLRAIEHARTSSPAADIDLVYEDRANPAIAIVENSLRDRGVAFRSRSGSMIENFVRLLAARTLISCPSTFAEAAALVSRNLASYYSFRDHCSQPEFKPFMQWQLAAVLGERRIRAVLVDDISRTYTNKWQWAASPAQVAAIATFDADHLRLYESL